MAAFRKLFPALAVLVLLGLVTTASAQTAAFQCTANAGVPPLLRSEGLTELTGDIVLNCTGGTPTPIGTQIPSANISVFLNTAVTSRLLSMVSGQPGNSEALLLIDEPNAALAAGAGGQVPCLVASTCPVYGTGGGATAFKGSDTATGGTATTTENIWVGTVSGNSVTFIGVPVEPPGTTGTRVYRITNLRANASAVAPGGFGTPGQVVALISATPATGPTGFTPSFPINNPQQIVGFVQTGLNFIVRNKANSDSLGSSAKQFYQCNDLARRTNNIHLRFQENFATSFKSRTVAAYAGTEVSPTPAAQAVPGLIYNAESGFYNPALASPLTSAGLADFGTRLKATFTNIPSGVRLFVGLTNVPAPGSTSVLAARLVGAEIGSFFPVASSTTDNFTAGSVALGNAVAELTPISGTATAVWEVLAADPLVAQNFDFPVFFGWTGNAANNSPALGTASVAGSFAPTPPVFSASAGAAASATLPIPRFVDTGAGTSFFVINQCRTNLLFPFVTNQLGFDTGLAIANTTQDPFGTSAQAGTCALNFYGANAPSAVTTSSIAGGTVYATLASTTAPNFQGYVIAVCNFQMGHGFAFVSDLGARNLAMGYLALVMPDPARQVPAITLAGGSGEVLGQ